jgi:hypothetical protein
LHFILRATAFLFLVYALASASTLTLTNALHSFLADFLLFLLFLI